MNYDIDASCGGKRRGCCIIPLNFEPDDLDADCTDLCSFLLVFGLPSGRPSHWAVVSLPASEAADFLGEATW